MVDKEQKPIEDDIWEKMRRSELKIAKFFGETAGGGIVEIDPSDVTEIFNEPALL